MRFRAPASIELRRAQLLLILAALVPTALALVAAILVLVFAKRSTDVVLGILLVVFGVLAVVGVAFTQAFLRRGDSLARLQNDFVSTVSHELRTPLTSIRMFVETLAMGRVQDLSQQQDVLKLLAKEVARLEALVERILELARLEAGKRQFVRVPTTVKDVVEGALAAFDAVRIASGGAAPTLTKHIDPALKIDADQPALEQALLNLISNAYKYAGEDKHINVRAVAHGPRRVEISVTDNGPGISREDQRVIFDKFERGSDPARHAPSGVGMGLAVVNMIVRAHGGRVDVLSAPGAGSTFRMLLPRSTP